ncbi:MAG: hypothetical protein HXP08_06905 [Veillonella dispar]|nr:hypothetical protein [Veillonella dispar]
MSSTHVHGFTYLNHINEDGESGQQTHYFDEETGLHLIHSSKKGAHIVPALPDIT